MPSLHSHTFSAQPRGFTVMELLVSVAIITLITGIVIVRQDTFDDSVSLTNLTYDVALSVRKAQSYGVNVREFNTGSGNFDIGYGIHFDHDDRTSYVFYGDADGDSVYDSGGNELIELYDLPQGYTYYICGILSDGSEDCSNPNNSSIWADIVYKRPDPDAVLTANNGSNYTAFEIHIESRGGKERVVRIEDGGRVYVK